MKFRAAVLLAGLAGGSGLSPSAMAAQPCEGLVSGPKGVVTSVVDGDTIMLDSGLVVRLIGIQAPKLALDRPGLEDWPLAETARQTLLERLEGQKIEVRYGGERTDRHGRTLGLLFDENGNWVQLDVLAAGLARVYSFPDNRTCLSELYAAEQSARRAGRGIWSSPFYRVRAAAEPDRIVPLEGRYELVEGRVLRADEVRGRIYLNFGRTRATDFTVVINPAALRLFRKAAIDPLALDNERIRVRGWIELNGGPRIEVTHPEQIELLGKLQGN
ncbi:MAG: thermonuclease family protein [Alphaproteobacteria bacterium]|nr:thermonuclease family protein [Alphaproteobacteria bacterium]